MRHESLLAMLLPPGSYAHGPALRAELAAEGRALDETMLSLDRAGGGITPFAAGEMLADWERVCGITPPGGAPYQQRLQLVLAKLAETGGLSIPYFIRLAAGMDTQIDINEPQPFRAGANRAGDTVWTADIIWVWQVVVHGSAGSRSFRFQAGQSAAGERLLSFGDPVIEAVFNDLKPAHTFVYFAYQ
ncbi:YmfQ family protein [Chromobacterium phragmitis]|uniref:Phage tail protein n=1 Tax=Chromobacterium phragmitis TaxID=2202141 RepID=A0A344UCY2_9NEIS|nr:putative phage tail protein [Chromobacterium phragmitis]AXE33130.1 phage tail protein [Chromobacterium phragmitis]